MIVCIAEKPSVGREIAQILGARSRRDGYYEGNGYAVTWTFGHFCTLKTPDDYTPDWKRWQLQTLPMIPEKFEIKLIGNKGVKKQFGVIKTLLKKATSVINCGDAGQEGELIQRWVLQHAKYKGPVQRLWISSLTAQAIRDGFKNLKPASDYNNLFYAGSSRAIGDWLLGMNATRAYTLKHGGYKQVLSIGRVQTPTLAMLVERYHEINNFKPEPYWELHTLYRETDFHYEKGRFEKKEDGDKLLAKVQDKPFEVIEVKKKNGKEYPPYLFDLTSLQVNCNRRFGFTADRTLKLVQSLYEQKVVTYPRVDTTYLPNDVYPKIPGILQQMGQYAQFTQSLLGKTIRKSAKVFNDKKVTDHHAIIPTGSEKNLVGDEQKVYDAIARRFLAAFYPDCLVANTTVIGSVDGVRFKATGKEILDPGWRVLYPRKSSSSNSKTNTGTSSDADKKKQGKGNENILPEFNKGEKGAHDPTLIEKMTQPPKHYSEATLLRGMETAGKKVEDEELRDLMKANGIGRPSTRANIIETLFRRKYAFRQKKLIIASETGIQLIGQISNDLLKSAELTGQWEKKLREIEEGTHGAGQFIRDMKNMVSNVIAEVKNARANPKIAAAAPVRTFKGRAGSKGKSTVNQKISNTKSKGKKALTETICPKCRRGKLLKGKTAYGCSQYKTGCTFRLPFEFMGKKISDNQLGRLMKLGSTVTLKGFVKNGNKINGNLAFDGNHQLIFQVDTKAATTTKKGTAKKKAADEIICPRCEKGKIVKGKTAYGCSNWKSGCGFKVSFAEIREAIGTRPVTKAAVVAVLTKLT